MSHILSPPEFISYALGFTCLLLCPECDSTLCLWPVTLTVLFNLFQGFHQSSQILPLKLTLLFYPQLPTWILLWSLQFLVWDFPASGGSDFLVLSLFLILQLKDFIYFGGTGV
jgi:hypothetical protein